MAKGKVVCQNCSRTSTSIKGFKKHLTSVKHEKEYLKAFPNEVFHRNWLSYTPWIFSMNRHHCSDSLLGLSQMTLCFCSELPESFFLCHVCEQIFGLPSGEAHLKDLNHFLQYFAYTDPNALSFLSYLSLGHDIPAELKPEIEKEHEKVGSGHLQMLHLPKELFKQCIQANYSLVMFLLHQNQVLSDTFKEIKPQRVMIPTYRNDPNRKHPLIGLQFIVECIYIQYSNLRHYLCTLCHLTMPSGKVIEHLLSFQHVHSYLSVWHPNTVKPRACYEVNNPDHNSILTDFANQSQNQSEKLHGRILMKQVKLDTSDMLFVIDARFEAGLSRLKSIAGNLVPYIKPGKKLEPTLPGSNAKPSKDKKEDVSVPTLPGTNEIPPKDKQEGISEPVTSEKEDVMKNINKEKEENTAELSATPAEPSYKFHCQNCSETFVTNALYFKHLSTCEHLKSLDKNFGIVKDTQPGDSKPDLPTLAEPDILCVGVPLVVTILCHQLSDEPVHLCFACEMVFKMKEMDFHMSSEKHIVQCLMYHDPWKLPFAWKTTMDFISLKSLASQEEGGKEQKIRILDVPPCIFPLNTPLSFSKVMDKLDSYRSLLTNGVPPRETLSKLQDNERFPILGRNFLVKYGQINLEWKFLCLLCERPLSLVDFTGHVFSWEHVVAFLEKFHPGSVDVKNTNEEMLLDFAKQAAVIHPVSNIQEIECDTASFMAEMKDYSTKIRRLSAVKLENGKGDLIPLITPKPKLFLRQRKEKVTNTDAQVEAIPDNAERPEDGSQSADQESTETSLQEVAGLPTEVAVKEENPSQPTQVEETKSVETSASDCKSTDAMNAALKRKHNPSDMDTSESDNENLKPKQECLSNQVGEKKLPSLQIVDEAKQCSSSDQAVVHSGPCYSPVLKSFIEAKIRQAVIGLKEVYECVCNDRAPIYLCMSCHLKFKEEYIGKHLVETWHYNTYLKTAGEYPLPTGKSWRKDMANLAMCYERREGCGKTKVVQLTPKEYGELDAEKVPQRAILIVKKCEAKMRLSKPGMKKVIDPEPTATSSTTKTPPPKDTNMTKTVDLKQSTVQVLAPVKASPTLPASSVSNDGKSFSNTGDGSEKTNEDANLKMVKSAVAGAPKPSKPVCTFITSRPVIPAADSKITNTPDGAVDQIQYTLSSASSTITGAPKTTTKPVCKFLSSKSAATNASSPAMTHPEETSIPMLVDTVRECSIVSATTLSNEVRATPDQQSESVLSNAVTKRKAESDTGCEPASKVATMGNDHSSAGSTTTESASSRSKVPSAAPATSTLNNSDMQDRSTRKPLKLNINAASHVKPDDPETLTPIAIERAKALLKNKCSKKPRQRRPSASTSVAPNVLCDIATSPNISVSPCDITSPDLGKDNSHNNTQKKTSAQPIKPLPVSAIVAPTPSPSVPKPTSIVTPRIIKGSTIEGPSHLSHFLAVGDIAVIGLCFVWECRVMPPKYPTFYLCESCSQTIPNDQIFYHMTDTLHNYDYLTRQYPQFMHWAEEELPQHVKCDLTDYIAELVIEREESTDAQTVLLSEECFEWVRNAPFFDALHVVQRIKEEKKTASLPFIAMPQQEGENSLV